MVKKFSNHQLWMGITTFTKDEVITPNITII